MPEAERMHDEDVIGERRFDFLNVCVSYGSGYEDPDVPATLLEKIPFRSDGGIELKKLADECGISVFDAAEKVCQAQRERYGVVYDRKRGIVFLPDAMEELSSYITELQSMRDDMTIRISCLIRVLDSWRLSKERSKL